MCRFVYVGRQNAGDDKHGAQNIHVDGYSFTGATVDQV